jgi:hypothetical protein
VLSNFFVSVTDAVASACLWQDFQANLILARVGSWTEITLKKLANRVTRSFEKNAQFFKK